jgi:peptide/nickel transport system substrate-binding protein
MKMKLKFPVLFTVLTLVMSACGGGVATNVPATQPPSAATEPPAKTGPTILHVGWLGIPDTLNPAYAFLSEAYTIFDLIYSPLVTEDKDGNYIGALAKEWSASDDGLTWSFTLKDGLKWHNGEDVTSEQVAWTINAIMEDPDGWAALSNYANGFSTVTASDEKTIVITTEQPIANMEYRLSFLYAVYPPDFETFTTPEDLQNFPNDQPIGTGMFKVNNFDKDKGVLILDANKDFVDGAAHLDQVIYQKFDTGDALIQALKAGDVDAINDPVPASAFETVKGFEGVTAIATDGRDFTELIINSADENHDPAPTANPALRDPAVRLAMETALNRQDLIDIVQQGLGSPGDTIVPPTLRGGFWHNPNIAVPEVNLDEANRILDEAGYTLGADGIREKDGNRLEFRLQFDADSASYPRIADLLSDWFGQIGIKTNPEAMNADSLIASTTYVGDYDLVIWGWSSDPDPDFILSVMLTDQFVEGGWSDSGYHNPEYDQLYLDQQAAVDRDKRQEIIWKMQEMVYTDRPYIVLYYNKMLEAYRSDRFTGFVESPLGIDDDSSLGLVVPVN